MVTETDQSQLRRLTFVFYLVLAGVGLLWSRVRTGTWLPASATGGDVVTSLLLGALLAAVTLAASGWLLDRIPWLRWFGEEIRRLLGPMGTGTALVLALCSGIGEEILFRGAMQPALGYVPASLIFGLLHTGPDRRYIGWTVFAITMGLALGGIVEVTDCLAGPVFAHFLVNFVNLRRIGRLLPPDDAPC